MEADTLANSGSTVLAVPVEPLTAEKREPYTAQLNPAMCTDSMKSLIGIVVKKEQTTESALIRHAVSLFLRSYFSVSGDMPETEGGDAQ